MTSRKACQWSAHLINDEQTQVGSVVASHAAFGNSFSDGQRLAEAQSIHANRLGSSCVLTNVRQNSVMHSTRSLQTCHARRRAVTYRSCDPLKAESQSFISAPIVITIQTVRTHSSADRCAFHHPLLIASSSSNHSAGASTPPTEVSNPPESPQFMPVLDTEDIRRRREQSDRASREIGVRLLQGWAMLADECPGLTCYGVPLVRPPKVGSDKDPRKVCLA